MTWLTFVSLCLSFCVCLCVNLSVCCDTEDERRHMNGKSAVRCHPLSQQPKASLSTSQCLEGVYATTVFCPRLACTVSSLSANMTCVGSTCLFKPNFKSEQDVPPTHSLEGDASLCGEGRKKIYFYPSGCFPFNYDRELD